MKLQLLHLGAKGHRSLIPLSVAFALAACSALVQSVVSIDGAEASSSSPISRVLVDEVHPVILHAVDEKPLPSLQVSNKLRSVTYLFRPGQHELWVSSAPYGLPLVPQRIKCFIINATLSASAEYHLAFDASKGVPILSSESTSVEGALVDQPLVIERGCKWR